MGNELSGEERSPTHASQSNAQQNRFSAATLTQDLRAKTREVAEKLKLTKAHSDEPNTSTPFKANAATLGHRGATAGGK